MTLTISIEKVTFGDTLRILGKITQGPEDIPRGDHHAFDIAANDVLTIEKEWFSYQKKKIDDAVNQKSANIIACIFDREEAIFAVLEKNTFKILSKISGDVEKKAYDSKSTGTKADNIYEQIIEELTRLNERYEPKIILCGCSHFWRQNLEREIQKLPWKSKTVLAVTHAISEAGFNELLLRPEVEKALQNIHISQSTTLVEEMFKRIATNQPVVYGFSDCQAAAVQGVIDTLLCTERLIKEMREKGTFKELENLLKTVEQFKGTVHIISGENEAAEKLHAIGGLIAKLRYAI